MLRLCFELIDGLELSNRKLYVKVVVIEIQMKVDRSFSENRLLIKTLQLEKCIFCESILDFKYKY